MPSRHVSLAAFVTCAVHLACTGTPAAEPSVLEQVISAWERRQKDVKTAEFAFTTERTDFMAAVADRTRIAKPKGTVLSGPEPTSTYVEEDAIWFDGRRVRHESQGPRRVFLPDLPEGRLIPTKEFAVFDGKGSRQYQLRESDVLLEKQGYSLKTARLPVQTTLNAKPFFTFIRPFDPDLGRIDQGELHYVRAEHLPDGRSCVVLERRKKTKMTRYWIDPAAAYGIARIVEQYAAGQVRDQIDVTYRRHDEYGWLPDHWTVSSFEQNGAPLAIQSCKLTKVRINPSIPESTFELKFPEGTHIVGDGAVEFQAGKEGELLPLIRPARSGSSSPLPYAVGLGLLIVSILVLMKRKRRLSAQ